MFSRALEFSEQFEINEILILKDIDRFLMQRF